MQIHANEVQGPPPTHHLQEEDGDGDGDDSDGDGDGDGYGDGDDVDIDVDGVSDSDGVGDGDDDGGGDGDTYLGVATARRQSVARSSVSLVCPLVRYTNIRIYTDNSATHPIFIVNYMRVCALCLCRVRVNVCVCVCVCV